MAVAARDTIQTWVSILVYSYFLGILQGYGTMIDSHILALSTAVLTCSCTPLVVH